LLLPLSATSLWPHGERRAVRTKLSTDAIEELLALARGERGRVPIKPQDVWTRERKVIDFGPLNASYGLNLDLNAGSTYGA
jgi:hypothetical protein